MAKIQYSRSDADTLSPCDIVEADHLVMAAAFVVKI